MSDVDIDRRRALQTLGVVGLGAIAGCTTGEHTYKTVPGRRGAEGQVPGEETTERATPTPANRDVEPSLSVKDQETDGSSVVIVEAKIDAPGWLAVYPQSAEETDEPVGKTLLDAGAHETVEVSLDPPLSEDQTLQAALHYDNPSNGSFDHPDGDPFVKSGVYRLSESFQVTVTK